MMWLFELFKLFYIFCVSFLPVIVDTGVQVKIFIFFAVSSDQGSLSRCGMG